MIALFRIWLALLLVRLIITVYPKRNTEHTAHAIQQFYGVVRKDVERLYREAKLRRARLR
jgi:hypothetical protein